MSFNDIFKKSFLKGFNADLNMTTIFFALLVAFIIGLLIFSVYRISTRKAFYSKSFNIALVGLTLITTGIILTIQSNAILSLGMVGALSIVRFRTAIKDPMDLVYLFWAIAVGIICGACMFELAIVLSISVALCIFILELFPVGKAPMILVINCLSVKDEDMIISIIRSNTNNMKVKSRSISKDSMDIVIELRTKKDKELMNALSEINSINSISLLNHDGEVTY